MMKEDVDHTGGAYTHSHRSATTRRGDGGSSVRERWTLNLGKLTPKRVGVMARVFPTSLTSELATPQC